MKTLRYFIEFLFIKFFFLLFKIIGYKNSSNLGGKIGSFIGPLFRSKSLTKSNIQNSLPALSFELHMYASDGKGWVRVNGKDFSEGQQIASGVVLQHILPQHVVLLFKEHSFTIPALTNW